MAGKMVHHLHGAFNTLSDTYDPDSFRNQLSDDLLDGEQMDPGYPHLYSNCLVSYTGDLKSHSMTQAGLANKGMEKFVEGYQNNPKLRQEIDNWDESNDLVRRLKEAVQLKSKHPELTHHDLYPYDEFKAMSGSLDIVGLSPNNDSHLFSLILENEQITEITFNYFDDCEAEEAKRVLARRSLSIREVREFWTELGEVSAPKSRP